ncbi:MAG: PEP-CTERM sorting domain-containing protein [Planctomycetota bacterium]
MFHPSAGIAITSLVAITSSLSITAQTLAPYQWERPTVANVNDIDGDTNAITSHQAWDIFSVFLGAPGNDPDVADVNRAGTANLEQTNPGAFITSSLNIYSFSSTNMFEVAIPVPELNTGTDNDVTLAVQIATLGNIPDQSTVMVTSGSTDYTPVDSALIFEFDITGNFGGIYQVWRYIFNIPDVGDGDPLTTDLVTYKFDAAGSSLSLDQLTVDTATLANGFVNEEVVLLGDMNIDGTVDSLDIPAFVQALTDEQGYANTYGFNPNEFGDFTGDGELSNLDIFGFVDLLSSIGTPDSEIEAIFTTVPEPSSLTLIGLAGFVLLSRRRWT